MANNVAQIQITAETGGLARALGGAARMLSGFGAKAINAVRGIGRIPQFGGQAIGHFAGSMATRGLDLVVDQGHDILDFERKLVAFGLAARMSGVELRGVGNAARSLSSTTELDATEVLRGARAYVDLAGAENYTADKLSLIARAASASGSDIGDMATVVYSLSNALHVTGPELENTIGGLLNQSKSGAIHFSQMAQELVALAPVYAQFGIRGREGAIRLGAALQIVRTGFGSASEAGTGLQRLMRSLPQHAKLFEKNGVQIFKKGSRTELLTLDQIMANIYKSKLRLDRPTLIKAFGRGEAERAYQLFLGDSVDKYHELIEAGERNGTVQEDLATKMTSSTGRIDAAMQRAKNTIASAFTPERIEAFAGAVDTLVSKIDPMLKIMEGIAGVMGAFFHTGQAINEALTPGTSKLAPTTIDDAKEYAERHGGSVEDAYRALQAQHSARMLTTQQIQDAAPEGRATKEANEIAVAAKFAPKNVMGWQGTREAGDQYIEAAHLSPETVEEIHRKAMESATDAAIASGKGYSAAQKTDSQMFGEAAKTLASAVRDAIRQGMQDSRPVINVDGNPLSLSIENSSRRRGRP